jgi:mRNA interferase MazF
MQFSIPCSPGDVVLVNFQYTDRPQVKKRPAVVLSVPQYQQSRLDAVMVGLTTELGRNYFGDCPIQEWQAAGLPKPSVAKGVIQTISQDMVDRRLGTLTSHDFSRVQGSVRQIFGF